MRSIIASAFALVLLFSSQPIFAAGQLAMAPGVYACDVPRFGSIRRVRHVTLAKDGSYKHWALDTEWGVSGDGHYTAGPDGLPRFTDGPLQGAAFSNFKRAEGSADPQWWFTISPNGSRPTTCRGPMPGY